MARNDTESAYFTLLRAREDLDALRRYEEYLAAEARRLRRTANEAAALAGEVDRRLLRALMHTDKPLAEAVEARQRVIADEANRLPDRIEAAEAFVEECEREYEILRRG